MIEGLFGQQSVAGELKAGLNQFTRTHRAIADGVANAMTPGFEQSLQAQLDAQDSSAGGVGADLEKNMVALADNQIRYQAATRLLNRVYSQLRTTMRNG